VLAALAWMPAGKNGTVCLSRICNQQTRHQCGNFVLSSTPRVNIPRKSARYLLRKPFKELLEERYLGRVWLIHCSTIVNTHVSADVIAAVICGDFAQGWI